MLKKILKTQGVQKLDRQSLKEIKGKAGNTVYYVSCVPYINGTVFCNLRGKKFVEIASSSAGYCPLPWEKNYSIICSD